MTSSEMTPADIAAVTGNRGNGGGFGGYGNGFEWIVILFLFAMFGGWGGNRGGGSGGGSFGGGGDYGLYPWLNQSNQIDDGFRDQMLNNNITSIRDGVSNLSTQLCNCCSDMQMSLLNGFNGVEQSANARQIANMQTAFAAQNAMNQGFNGLQSQLAQCCCDNRLATVQTQNVVQNEGNMTRFADANNTRDIIDSNTRGTQAILDKLCQLELDGLKQDNANLRTQLNMANLAASQIAQTAEIQRGQVAEVDALYERLRSCPVPTQPVYGSQPIFTCNGNQGCGCGNM